MNFRALRPAILRLLLAFTLSPFAHATVKTYVHPPASALTPALGLTYATTYTVRVRGADNVWKSAPVYDADPNDLYQTLASKITGWDPGVFTNFDTNEPVSVEVTYGSLVTSAVIHPKGKGIAPVISGNKVTFVLSGPMQVGVDINGNIGRPLWVFANPVELSTDIPVPINPASGNTPAVYAADVLFVPAGTIYDVAARNPGNTVTNASEVKFGTSAGTYKTIYVEGGAVLKGGVTGTGSGVRLLGRGIILSPKAYYTAPSNVDLRPALSFGGTDVTIKGLTVVGQAFGNWTCWFINVNGATVTNLKVIGIRRDGFDPIGVKDCTITDSFFYSYDDAIAIKANQYSGYDNRNILIEGCIMWNHTVSLGFESRTDSYDNIIIRDCDFIRPRSNNNSMPGEPTRDIRIPLMAVTISDRAAVTNVEWNDIRIYDPVNVDLFHARVAYNYASTEQMRGRINGVTLTDIQVLDLDRSQLHEFILEGAGPSNKVENVTVDNLTFNGQPVLDGYSLGAWVLSNVGAWSITGGSTVYAPLGKTVTLRCNSNQKYAYTGADGLQPMVAATSAAGLSELNFFDVLWSSASGSIGLRCRANGLNAQLANGGATPTTDSLKCVTTNFGAWEKFAVKRNSVPSGYFTLKTVNGNNLDANPNGTNPLRAATSNDTLWAQFYFDPVVVDPVPSAGRRIALRGHSGKYLSSENGAQPVHVNRTVVGAWERFTVVAATAGKVALQASDGRYLSVNGAALETTATVVGVNQSFTLEPVAAGQVALVAFNGNYVGCRYSAPSELWADRNMITQESTFSWTVQ